MNISAKIALVILTATSVSSVAAQDSMEEDWQQQHLLSATAKERLAAQKGQPVVHDGFPEPVAEQALDDQFKRNNSTMFVQIEHPVQDGENFADDDCD